MDSNFTFYCTALGTSSYFTAVVFPSRIQGYYSDFRQILYVVGFSVIGIFMVFTFSEYVCDISLILGCWLSLALHSLELLFLYIGS